MDCREPFSGEGPADGKFGRGPERFSNGVLGDLRKRRRSSSRLCPVSWVLRFEGTFANRCLGKLIAAGGGGGGIDCGCRCRSTAQTRRSWSTKRMTFLDGRWSTTANGR